MNTKKLLIVFNYLINLAINNIIPPIIGNNIKIPPTKYKISFSVSNFFIFMESTTIRTPIKILIIHNSASQF